LIELKVDLGDRTYPILIAENCLEAVRVSDYLKGSQALVVTNETVAPLYLEQLLGKLKKEGVSAQSLVLPDGEKYKSMETLSQVFDCLISHRHNRTTTLIALGGGVIGDMTGFAAACYQRGVAFVQVPTTLLAQVDSSVGGKTAVNHPSGKNMIGAFYQPQSVLIDINTLSTLPEREFSAGVAEVIKYGLIADVEFFHWLEDNIDQLMARDSDAIAHAIAVSCQTKANVVAADETEQGIRAILNLGHTFGHAIEAAQHYQDWLHGEAVGAGMVMAAELSMREGLISSQDFLRTETLISKANLPTKAPADISSERFMDLMGLDKKVLDGRIRLVLMRSIGDAFVTKDFDYENLEAVLNTSSDESC